MAMSELGAFFQRHREEQNLTLEELEARTRIRQKYLQAIEAGEWDSLPPGVYTRGLLRSYARAIGVSQASVLRMYVKERPSEARLPEPQLISQPLIQQPRFNFEILLSLVLLAVAVGLFSWMVVTQLLPVLREAGRPALGQPVALSSTATPTATPTRSSRGATPTRSPRRGGTALPLATATPKATATPESMLKLEAKALTNDVWLRVVADGEEVFTGFLRGGEAQQWAAETTVRVRTGNAGDTQITLNGRRVDPLGGRGEVIERQWRLLPNGDIEQSS